MKRLLTAIALIAALTGPALAHTRSQSQSAWRIEGDRLSARIEADALDVTRLYALGGNAPLADTFAREAASGFDVSAGGRPCALAAPPQASATGNGRIVARLVFDCSQGALAKGEATITSRLFLRVAPSHLHFIALLDSEGHSGEAVLTENSPRARLEPTATPPREGFAQALARFVPIGAMHVWSGPDHIAFILALVLAVGARLGPALLAATGFTLGHTLTLGLAATGVLKPDTHAIEALIGFTIAYVAIEVGAGGSERMRAWSPAIAAALCCAGAVSLFGNAQLSPLIWFGIAAFAIAYPRSALRNVALLAAMFGLIHGCGFAGALNELALPRPRLIASLLGFNLGVELGQAVIIGATLGAGALLRRAPVARDPTLAHAAGAALFALGLYWFVARLAA